MTNQLALFTEPGIGTRCHHCQTFLQLPNIPVPLYRDGEHWGYLHASCWAPFSLKAIILFPTRTFTTGA